MKRIQSTSSDSGFWTTIDLLIGREWRDRHNDAYDENEVKKNLQKSLAAAKYGKLKRSARKSFSIRFDKDDVLCKDPVGILSSEASIDLRLQNSRQESFTDKDHMQRLRDHVQLLAEEALQKRITARQSDEMERLKKLLLSGKTPLKECPPELRDQPVFVFWRLVEKEVQRLKKSKSDIHQSRLRRSRRKGTQSEPGTSIDSEDSNLSKNNNEPFECNNQKNESQCGSSSNLPDTKPFVPQATTPFKYEDESVKELRELMTVEELYQMADRIIGICRDPDSVR